MDHSGFGCISGVLCVGQDERDESLFVWFQVACSSRCLLVVVFMCSADLDVVEVDED